MPAQPGSSVPHGPLLTSFWHFPPASNVLPAVNKSPSNAIGSEPTAVRLFSLLAQRSGTLCPKTCRIPNLQLIVLGNYRRHSYFSQYYFTVHLLPDTVQGCATHVQCTRWPVSGRVVLNYMVKIKLRAMLSLTLSNNTFLWIIILCQIWARKINVYR